MTSPENAPHLSQIEKLSTDEIIQEMDVTPDQLSLGGLVGLVKERGFRDGIGAYRLAKTELKIGLLDEDRDVYADAAASNIERRKPGDTGDLMTDIKAQIRGDLPEKRDYNPLANWDKKHRSARKGFGFTTDVEVGYPAVDRSRGARSFLQRKFAVRQALRLDAINDRYQGVRDLVGSYGEDILDKDSQNALIENGRYSHGEKKSIKHAGKRARSQMRSIKRINDRLQKAKDSEDLPGKVISKRIKVLNNRANRIESGIEKREKDKRVSAEIEARKQRQRARSTS